MGLVLQQNRVILVDLEVHFVQVILVFLCLPVNLDSQACLVLVVQKDLLDLWLHQVLYVHQAQVVQSHPVVQAVPADLMVHLCLAVLQYLVSQEVL